MMLIGMQYLVERLTGYLIEHFWNSLVFWRSVTLLILAVAFMGYFFRAHLKSFLLRMDDRGHDKEIFTRSNDIISEEFLMEYLYLLAADIGFPIEYARKTRDFLYFFAQEGNKYSLPPLRKVCKKLCNALHDLDESVARHTFPLQHDRDRYQVYPELKNAATEEDRQQWQSAQAEIGKRVKETSARYRQYRAGVRTTLLV